MYFCHRSSHLQWPVACRSCLLACGAVELEVWTELKTAGRRETERGAQRKQNRLNKHEWIGLNFMPEQEFIGYQVPTIPENRSGRKTLCLLQVEHIFKLASKLMWQLIKLTFLFFDCVPPDAVESPGLTARLPLPNSLHTRRFTRRLTNKLDQKTNNCVCCRLNRVSLKIVTS